MTNPDILSPSVSSENFTREEVQAASAKAVEEALRLAEIGEYLYNRSYSYGDGRTEPREYGIEWQWQQSKPDEFGEGVLLAEAVRWHGEMSEDGIVTEASKLRFTVEALKAENAALLSRVERLEKALSFYAEEKNWVDTPSWDGDPECITPKAIPVSSEGEGVRVCDCGDTARAALAIMEGSTNG